MGQEPRAIHHGHVRTCKSVPLRHFPALWNMHSIVLISSGGRPHVGPTSTTCKGAEHIPALSPIAVLSLALLA